MKNSRYSPTPTLRTDGNNRIVEWNLAFQVLLARDLAGCLRHGMARLLEQLAPHLDADFLPANLEAHWRTDVASRQAERDWVLEQPVAYSSRDFGRVELTNVAVPSISPVTGAPQGMFLYCRPMRVEQPEQYRRMLNDRWNHALMWDMYAASYDRVLPRLPFYQAMVESHVETVLQSGARDVLDMGAGTGNVTIQLLRAGCRVTAVDLGEAMLAHLSAKVDDAVADRLTLIEENAESVPDLDDESFDAVTISHVLYDMVNPESAWAEALRLLRPGGAIVVTEPNAEFDLQHLLDSGRRALEEQGIYEQLEQDWARVSSAGHELKILERSARLRPTEIRDRLQAAGYQGATLRPAYLGSCSTVVGFKPKTADS